MTRAFYSFHFSGDVSRVGQVRNIGVIEGDQLVDDNSWEKVKKGGSKAIEGWIDRQMAACDVVIVLVGKETAERPWVRYEIERAWNTRKKIFGIRIHGLKNLLGQTGSWGENPFDNIKLTDGSRLSAYVPLHDPFGFSSQQVYAIIKENIEKWIRLAPSRNS